MREIRALITEIGMFLSTEVIAVYVGLVMLAAGFREQVIIESTAEGVGVFGIGMVIATLMILILIRYLNKKIIFQLLFAWLIFIGSLFVFEAFFAFPLAIMFSVILVALRFIKPVVWVQNVAMILAIAGISPQLAMYFGTTTIIVILILASIYDYFAVFKTKHMVTMFENLMKHNTPFTFVVPAEGKMSGKVDSKIHKKKSEGKREYYLLGTGDIAFPTVFIVALLADYSATAALFALVGSIVGLVLDHMYLMNLKKPIPALPAIAACSILGFLIYLVV